jgi:hypothetical protein
MRSYREADAGSKSMEIRHHASCRANRPDKPKQETEKPIQILDISDTQVVHQCTDCGAYVTMTYSVKKPSSKGAEK